MIWQNVFKVLRCRANGTILDQKTASNLPNERGTKGERGGTPADYSSQTPATTAAPQANLRVVRHRLEGTPQAGNIGSGEGG